MYNRFEAGSVENLSSQTTLSNTESFYSTYIRKFHCPDLKNIIYPNVMRIEGGRLALIICLTVGISFGIGYLIGHFAHPYNNQEHDSIVDNYKYYSLLIEEDSFRATQDFMDEISSKQISEHLKYLSSIPHLAGTPGDKVSADYVYDFWKEINMDVVKINDYDVYLDYPDPIKPNNIEIRDSSDNIENLYEIKETIYDLYLDYSEIPFPFLAYSQNGSFKTDEIYYANYCNQEDFDYLVTLGINITDKMVICRYGRVFRGNKIRNAQINGAKGVILYDDPLRSAPQEATEKVYPNGDFLPKDGTQRGTVYSRDGDPLTPLYPSTEYAYRFTEDKLEDFPKIIAQVIGYGLAEEIFKLLDDQNYVKKDWEGELPIKYAYGGKLKSDRSLTLNVLNQKMISKIYNVIGIIKGSVEPDRYVMIGNHRDAWTFGALDPLIGTSIMLEISRSMMSLKNKTSWNPKRSIIFTSWSAEEYGIVGSTEWVEEYEKKLLANSIVYINTDIAVYGNYSYEAKASPLLNDLLYNVTKSIKINENLSVFDRWLENDPDELKTLPKINPHMGSNSDHMGFLQRLGVPCIDQKYGRNKKDTLYSNIPGSYPLYHTSYETYNLFTKYIDPEFKASKLMATIIGETARRISSSLILPFNAQTYAMELTKQFNLFKAKYLANFDELNISLDNLDNSIVNFTVVTSEFHKRLNSLDKGRYNLIRQYNEQLRNLERAFLNFETLKLDGYMHIIFAPSFYNKYTSNAFPTLVSSLEKYQKEKTLKIFTI